MTDNTINHSKHTALVTGANSGLGFEAAAQLAEVSYGHVILACRTLAKAEDARARLVARTGKDVFGTLAVDVAELKSSSAAAASLVDAGELGTDASGKFYGSPPKALVGPYEPQQHALFADEAMQDAAFRSVVRLCGVGLPSAIAPNAEAPKRRTPKRRTPKRRATGFRAPQRHQPRRSRPKKTNEIVFCYPLSL